LYQLVSHRLRLALLFLLSTLAACGGKSSKPGEDGVGATGGGGSDTGGTGTGGVNQAGHAGTGGSVCTSYDDDYPAAVNVSIANQTQATLYLGQDMVTCGIAPLFQVADADGSPLPALGDCRSSCASLRQQEAAGCADICAFPNTVQLLPGEVFYTTWDGLFAVQGQLPSTCVLNDDGGGAHVSCDQAKRIEPGTFTFSAQAGGAFDCSQTTGDSACAPCTATPGGGCTRSASLIEGPLRTTQATVALDETYGVYPAPSPAPTPNAGADAPAPGGNVALRTVELIFSE
jgi:hypothetical protein